MSSDIDVATRGEVTGDGTTSVSRIRRRWRTTRGWVLLGAIVALIAIVSFIVHGATSPNGRLEAGNPRPDGIQALLRTLSDHGVHTTSTGRLDAAVRAVGPDTTLALYDPSGLLTEHARARLVRAAHRSGADVVLIAPGRKLTDALAPGIEPAGGTEVDDPAEAQSFTSDSAGPVRADCTDETASRAGSVTGGGRQYRRAGAGHHVSICFGSGGRGTFARYVQDGASRTVVGNWSVFANGRITDYGNAALAIEALGANPDLVYYRPEPGDPALESDTSLIDVLPGWVLPAGGWLVLTALVAMFWRGRRLGPLAREDLPVVVRAAETMEGRARLYRRSGARDRVALTLRAGTMSRLAAHLKLPRSATADDVCAAVAAAARRPERDVTALLIHSRPTTDDDLGRLARELDTLEREVHAL